jgi:hypothetical protein
VEKWLRPDVQLDRRSIVAVAVNREANAFADRTVLPSTSHFPELAVDVNAQIGVPDRVRDRRGKVAKSLASGYTLQIETVVALKTCFSHRSSLLPCLLDFYKTVAFFAVANDPLRIFGLRVFHFRFFERFTVYRPLLVFLKIRFFLFSHSSFPPFCGF